jgi:hypothetical protein
MQSIVALGEGWLSIVMEIGVIVARVSPGGRQL